MAARPGVEAAAEGGPGGAPAWAEVAGAARMQGVPGCPGVRAVSWRKIGLERSRRCGWSSVVSGGLDSRGRSCQQILGVRRHGQEQRQHDAGGPADQIQPRFLNHRNGSTALSAITVRP